MVEMRISTTVMESSMEIPQKAKSRTGMWSSDTAPGHLLLSNVKLFSSGTS
jgi:hypothetical protein